MLRTGGFFSSVPGIITAAASQKPFSTTTPSSDGFHGPLFRADWPCTWSEGYLSTFTTEALRTREIELRHTGPGRIGLSEGDLLQSNYRIAMDRSEHFQMMLTQFPTWVDQIDYWDVSDIPFRSSTEALPEIELKVMQLLDTFSR